MLTIFFRAVILYTVSVAAVRLMGKRQIGQPQPYELVLAILIADLAAGPMSGAETPLAYGLVPIAALVIMHSAASLLGMKSPPFRRLLNGTARVLVLSGSIQYGELDAAARAGAAGRELPHSSFTQDRICRLMM